jgi:hypothetical protein
MSSYCLIHSSGQGPQGWKLVVDELERRGHRVLTPALDLPRAADEGLAYHAETVVEALAEWGVPSLDVVCLAHSASGMYLPLIYFAQRVRVVLVFREPNLSGMPREVDMRAEV